MEIILKKQFIKEVAKLPEKVQTAIKEILDELERIDSLQNARIDIKRMEGQSAEENYYRIRVGSYRIGLEYIAPQVIILTVLSRGYIYKKFPPK